MLRKRIIAVVTVKQGWVVQSFSYDQYLPVGKVEHIVENLDRWGVDEICIQVIDRSINQLGPDFDLLEKIACLGLGTPITYGGGIQSVEHAIDVIRKGADRICIDALIQETPEIINEISFKLGAQAIIINLPIKLVDHELKHYDYRSAQSSPLSGEILSLLNSGAVSEVLLTDTEHEGSLAGFNQTILDVSEHISIPIIAFGGATDINVIKSLLLKENVSAVALGNALNYSEHAVQKIKDQLVETPVRPSNYRTY